LVRDCKTTELVWFVVPFLLVFGCYLAWRLNYYGSWLPTSAVAKVGSATLTQRVNRGLLDLYFLQKHFTPLLWLLPLLVLLRRGRNQGVSYLLFVSGAFALSFLVGLGGDWMPLFRLFVPILPVLMVLVVEGVETAATGVERISFGDRRRVLFGLLMATLVLANPPLAYLSKHVKLSAWWLAEPHLQLQGAGTRPYGRALGLRLESLAAKGDLLAVADAGVIPYYAGLNTIDFSGLTDPRVKDIMVQESKPITKRYAEVAVYVLSRQPKFVQAEDFVGEMLRASPEFQFSYSPLPGWEGAPIFVRSDAQGR
jgi:hypothetical protein